MAYSYYQERTALGCRVQLTLVASETDLPATQRDDMFRKLWLEIFLFEKRCSRFLPASELSQFNRAAGQKQPITAEFRDILLAARLMAQRTQGLFNPFVLPALQRAGYVGSFLPEHAADVADDHSSKRVVPAEALEIGDDWATIPYGTAIELGGCGKGYIGDQLAAMVAGDGRLRGFWFSLGGDVVVGGHDESGDDWKIYLQPDPDKPAVIGEAKMPGAGRFAVATSTTRRRQGHHKAKAWHHIIDPRSGLPSDTGLTLATVCGGGLLAADVLASCVIISGPEDTPALLAGFGDEVSGVLWQGGADGSNQPIHAEGPALKVY